MAVNKVILTQPLGGISSERMIVHSVPHNRWFLAATTVRSNVDGGDPDIHNVYAVYCLTNGKCLLIRMHGRGRGEAYRLNEDGECDASNIEFDLTEDPGESQPLRYLRPLGNDEIVAMSGYGSALF